MFEEVDYIDGVQEFIESEYITELLEKGKNTFKLRGEPVTDSVRFSGDVSLFTKQVYNEKDLTIPSSWVLLNVNGVYTIKIDKSVITSNYTFTYVTYISKSKNKREGLFSVDYDTGVLYLSTGIKKARISFRKAIQYVEGQQMEQVDRKEYTKENLYNIPTDSDTRLTYVYQLKNNQKKLRSRELVRNSRVSLVTLGDKDD